MTDNMRKLDGPTTAFGLAAAITVLFNTVLAWFKEAFPAVHDAMTAITGHHWVTHGLADIIVFVVLGFIFLSAGTGQRMEGTKLVTTLVVAVVIAGLGLAGWFVVV